MSVRIITFEKIILFQINKLMKILIIKDIIIKLKCYGLICTLYTNFERAIFSG